MGVSKLSVKVIKGILHFFLEIGSFYYIIWKSMRPETVWLLIFF